MKREQESLSLKRLKEWQSGFKIVGVKAETSGIS
jgi:hypothetical protein